MFHLVDFKGERKRTVVPDTWLSINDTLCLLPPKVTDQDLEVLVRNRIEPGEGWQIFGVSSFKTFETYLDAKKQLEKSEETPPLQVDPQRKRKKPSFLEDNTILNFGGGQDQNINAYTVFRTEDDEEDDDVSENERILPSAPQFIPRANKVSPYKRMVQYHGHKRRIMLFNQSRPAFQKQTVSESRAQVKCACKSSCHNAILQTLHSMQKQLDKTNQMMQQLCQHQKLTPSQPKNLFRRQPVNHMNDQEEMDALSSEDTNSAQCNQTRAVTQKRTETPTSFSAAVDKPTVSEAEIIKNIDVQKWLLSDPKGRLLNYKLNSEIFFPKDRKLLVRIVCEKLIEHCGNAYPTTLMKEKLAKEIVKAFPFLKSSRGAGHETFYDIKTGNGFIAYRLKTIRLSLPAEEKKNNSSSQQQMLADSAQVIAVKEELISESDLEENVAWMAQQDPDEENKTMIVTKLKETMKNRQKEIKETDMSVAEIFNRYPRLKDYKGEMINMEFTELYSNGDKFLKKFESYFAPRILSYVTLHKPHLLLHVSNCEDNMKSLLLLPELLPIPNYIRKGKRTEQSSKASKYAQQVPNARKIPSPDLIAFVDSEESFLEVTSDTDAQSLQPYLICRTWPRESGRKKYFIRVDETLIEGPDDGVSAFDVLFKLHYAINIQYAKSLENFYNFVSSIIYEMDAPRCSSDAFYTLLRNIPVSVDEE